MLRALIARTHNALERMACSLGVDAGNPARYRHDDGPWLSPGSCASSEITVSWVTRLRTTTRLALGTDPGSLVPHYSRAMPSKYHHARLTDLTPATTYYYRIISPFEGASTHSFTLPAEGARDLTFCIIGDMQPTDHQQFLVSRSVAEGVARENPHLVVQLGDSVHRGTVQEYWHWMWQACEPFASRFPTLRAMGNHDWGYDLGKSWRRFFPIPFVDPKKSYYSQHVGNVHAVFLDCYENDERMGSQQLSWLKEQLQSSPPGCWKFVFLHASIFSSGMENMDYTVQQQLLPLFDRHGVHAVFYGHDHIYEHYRYAYGQNDRVFSPGHRPTGRPIHYFLSGGGGAPLEDTFGIHHRPLSMHHRTWYSPQKGEFVRDEWAVRSWTSAHTVPEAPQCANPGAHVTCHMPSAVAQDDCTHFGFEYGENACHYLRVMIQGEQCTVSVQYPDGSNVSGPNGQFPQVWKIFL
ncbi:metallophosphoesterase family protein [Myxococcota bacterium]|nr:metallophosphoesterase family protein [Myxococcota bacterium]MBU1536642.1 metallophosphoesterase family protein [Myxococcota bacterium]